uniref:Secreted protein n=1 Tax=Lutzomyia longipalpis TaxID=7200 RepID=A0A1B0CH25_LUTLO
MLKLSIIFVILAAVLSLSIASPIDVQVGVNVQVPEISKVLPNDGNDNKNEIVLFLKELRDLIDKLIETFSAPGDVDVDAVVVDLYRETPGLLERIDRGFFGGIFPQFGFLNNRGKWPN